MSHTLEQQQQRGMRMALLSQTTGMLFTIILKYGLLLLYFKALAIPSTRVLVYLSLPFLAFFLTIPFSPLVDAWGRKKCGIFGLILSTSGVAAITAAATFPATMAELLIVAGLLCYSVGQALFSCGWFVLLLPLVPEHRRARYFGVLRITWQLTGLIFVGVVAWLLGDQPPLWAYQIMLGAVCAGQLFRLLAYMRIPELERPSGKREALLPSLLLVLRQPGYLPLVTYVFLLGLCCISTPTLFVFVQSEALQMGDGAVAFYGNLGMVGALMGLIVGGQVVDRIGSRYVFLIGHLLYVVMFTLFIMRGVWPWPLGFTVGSAHFIHGFVAAATGLAFTTELLALIPAQGRSLATSVGLSMTLGAGAIAGMLAAVLLDIGLFAAEWSLFGQQLTAYDGLLFLSAIGVLFLVVTLGLVPSVLRPAQVLPAT